MLASSVRVPLAELAISNGLFPALAGVVKMLAEELGPSGIRMNGILPVRIATDRVRELDALSGDPDEVRAQKSRDIPRRRYGEPQEFGRVAAFLLSPAASYVTGAMIPVDGGSIRSIRRLGGAESGAGTWWPALSDLGPDRPPTRLLGMAESWNEKVIAEFRANDGRVGGNFAGAPLLLLHSTGARSRSERVSPMMCQQTDTGWAVFASYAGKDINPAWYHNLLAHPDASVEIGTDKIDVHARELHGAERSVIWEEQKRRYPGFADYERQTTRTIPVLLLTRR